VICNALLNKFIVSEEELKSLKTFLSSNESDYLESVFTPLIRLEENAIENRRSDLLTYILENGSLEVFSIEHTDSPISTELEKVLVNIRQTGVSGVDSLISRYYGGVYFSYRQAVCIDTILRGINKCIHEQNRDLFIAALLSTASDIVGTVGKQFAQPLKARDSKGVIKKTVYNKAAKDKTLDVMALFWEWLDKYINLPRTDFTHIVEKNDYIDCLNSLPENVSTIYADPPYTRDHYSRFYHVLETMALRDEPELSTVKIKGEIHISNGIYRKDRYQSPFCICSKAVDAFSNLFETAADNKKNLILSYSPYDETKNSHPRVVTMRQLTENAQLFFNDVQILSAGHFVHNKLTSADRFLEASDEAELLIVCTNK